MTAKVKVVIWNEPATGSAFEIGDRVEIARVDACREVLGICDATPEEVREVLESHFGDAPTVDLLAAALRGQDVVIGESSVADACSPIYLTLIPLKQDRL